MFTGIIKKTSTITNVTRQNESLLVSVKKEPNWKVKLGQSISINGVCSTVKSFTKNSFLVEYMPETIKKATVGNYKPGTMVNLETSLSLNTMLDGHIVQGHVDTAAKVIEIKALKDSRIIKFQLPAQFMRFIADKGSITVDGISLTVVDTGKNWFTVSLVSYTISHTNFQNTKNGDLVNIETDVLAKYIYKLIKK